MSIKQEVNAPLIITIGVVSGFLFLVIVIGLQAWYMWAQQLETQAKWEQAGPSEAKTMIQEQEARISHYAITGDGRATIPIEVAMNAVRQLRETGKVVRGQLGVRIQDVDRELAGELGLDRPVGAYVVSVENDSAAAKAGIRPGDVILAFNGQDIARSAQLPPLVGALAPGARASLEVLREGKRRNLVAVLEALEPSELVATAEPTPAQTAPDLLGLVVEELGAARRAELGLGAGEGVRIARVTGLAARQAGLNPGDVILQVGRQKVGSVAEFREVAKAYGPGDEVRLLVRNARSTGFVSFILR